MDWNVLITALVGCVTTFISGFGTWLFSRKKYNVGVDTDKISNMEASLSFYEKLTESNNKILTDILEKSERLAESNVKLMIEVQNLKAQVDLLVTILKNELGEINLDKYGIKIQDGAVIKLNRKDGTETTKN